jgi:hypothetical protein
VLSVFLLLVAARLTLPQPCLAPPEEPGSFVYKVTSAEWGRFEPSCAKCVTAAEWTRTNFSATLAADGTGGSRADLDRSSGRATGSSWPCPRLGAKMVKAHCAAPEQSSRRALPCINAEVDVREVVRLNWEKRRQHPLLGRIIPDYRSACAALIPPPLEQRSFECGPLRPRLAHGSGSWRPATAAAARNHRCGAYFPARWRGLLAAAGAPNKRSAPVLRFAPAFGSRRA